MSLEQMLQKAFRHKAAFNTDEGAAVAHRQESYQQQSRLQLACQAAVTPSLHLRNCSHGATAQQTEKE
jgi:hypothetical protein